MENPIALWYERLWQWFTAHAQKPHALAWLALIAYTDALFFPIAPEVFLAALVLAHRERAGRYLAVAATFSALGAASGYFVAAFLFHQFGEPILAFYHLEHAFALARHYIAGHVFFAMAFASFTPVPDKVFIYAGGFLGVNFVQFFVGYVLGRSARMALVAYLTERFGPRALDLINRYLLWFAATVLVLGTIYAMVHWHLFGL